MIIIANEHLDELMRVPTNERSEDCDAYYFLISHYLCRYFLTSFSVRHKF